MARNITTITNLTVCLQRPSVRTIMSRYVSTVQRLVRPWDHHGDDDVVAAETIVVNFALTW